MITRSRRLLLLIAPAIAGLIMAPGVMAYQATATVTVTFGGNSNSNGSNSYPQRPYSADADVFWTPYLANSLTGFSNTTYLTASAGWNGLNYYNSDFASSSTCQAAADDYGAMLLSVRKYSCNTDFGAIPVTETDDGPLGQASGTITVTDTTVTGTLTIISTTDEPTGATATTAGNNPPTPVSNTVGRGLNGYNYRFADPHFVANGWNGTTTSGTYTLNLTGTFTATSWHIRGGSARYSDAGFLCQQGATTVNPILLCSARTEAGGNSYDGSNLSWGWDLDGGGTGTAVGEIPIYNGNGTSFRFNLSGVLANISVDANGNITTSSGEFRRAQGSASSGCPNQIRYDGSSINCGTHLTAGKLVVTGRVALPYNLVGYYQRSLTLPGVADGTLSSVVFKAGAAQGCPGPTYIQPCYDPANSDITAAEVAVAAAGLPTWAWDGTTLTSVGEFWASALPTSNPTTDRLAFTDRVIDLAITPATAETNASEYNCREGAYMRLGGVSGCRNLYVGDNGNYDTSRLYNVGNNPKCITMTVTPDDYSFFGGSPGVPGTAVARGLTAQAADEAGAGCAQTAGGFFGASGAFDLWDVVRDDGTYLILANTTNIGTCYMFGSGATSACPVNATLAGISYLVFARPGAPDTDSDGNLDGLDNCPATANVDQLDSDGDGRGNVCDNCTAAANNVTGNVPHTAAIPRSQFDADGDGYGNACDADINQSGNTTTADYTLLRNVLSHFDDETAATCTAPCIPGNIIKADMNGSGQVTSADYTLLRNRLSTPPGPSGYHP